jgi:hypothetical protein
MNLSDRARGNSDNPITIDVEKRDVYGPWSRISVESDVRKCQGPHCPRRTPSPMSELMKPRNKPFVVEFKQGRRGAKRPEPSIWGDVDLSALKTDASAPETEPPQHAVRPAHDAGRPQSPDPSRASRILPALAPPTPSKISGRAAKMSAVAEPVVTETPVDDCPVSPTTLTKRIRRSRSRGMAEKPLPAGQRWKRRLPKILR